MRKKAWIFLMIILTAALFAGYDSIGMADGAGQGIKKEEVKKHEHKAKRRRSEGKKEAGEGGAKSSSGSGPSEGGGVTGSVNRAAKKAMDSAHKGAEAVKDGLNEGYDRLKNSK